MKIAICILRIGQKYKEITEYSKLNKTEYCKKYNYDFIEDDTCYDNNKPIPWSKINLILKYIDNYDYIVWFDSDLNIMNLSIKLEDLITERMKDADIMCGSDWKMINTGVLFVKNSDFSKKFLKDVYNNTEYNPDEDKINFKYGNHEQGSFIYLYEKNHMNSKLKIIVNEPTIMNSYWFNYYPGHFVLHFAGVKDENMLRFMITTMNPTRLPDDTDKSYEKRIYYINNELRKEFDSKL